MTTNANNKQENKKKVIVFGSGYAGRSFVTHIDKKKYDVTIVTDNLCCSKRSMPFISQPNFLDTFNSGSNKHTSSWALPDNATLIRGNLTKFFIDEKMFAVDETNVCQYDYAVFAVGSVTNSFGITGVDKYCLQYKTEHDAIKLVKLFEDDKLNKSSKVAVLGGGILGVELSSTLADKCDVTIFEMAPTILPIKGFEFKSDILCIQSHLQSQGITINAGYKVVGVEEKGNKKVIHFDSKSSEEFDEIIYTCGVKPNPVIRDNLNFKSVNGLFQVVTKDNKVLTDVFTIGDCNGLVPQSAQNAKQQGLHLASNLNNSTENPYVFKTSGTVIRLNNKVYVKSDYYNGFAPLFVHSAITYFNL